MKISIFRFIIHTACLNQLLVAGKIHTIAQNFHLPRVCLLCQTLFRGINPICDFCYNLLPKLGYCCRICALPLPESSFSLCGACIKKKPIIDRVITAYRYEEPLRTLIHQFKYQEGLYLAAFLAKIMLESFSFQFPKNTVIIPVPLHPLRLKQRGFNQASILALLLAKKLNLKVDQKICRRIVDTKPQAQLEFKERKKNLQQAFVVEACNYEHVILIDDLITTGITVSIIAKQLKRLGVVKVHAWCCARTCLL